MQGVVARYRAADDPLPASQWVWPLYGAGLEQLGLAGAPIERPLELPGPDELLARVDAAGLCFSDAKVIQLGAQHPRLGGRDLAVHPVVPGHEASITVVAVGERWRRQYQIGQRFTVQPAVVFQGQSMPYGYTLEGAFQQYSRIGPQMLAGDEGSYLLPVPEAMTYAGAALSEPWACVEAAYRDRYRVTLKPGGRTWLVAGPRARAGYQIGALWPDGRGPLSVTVSDLPQDLARLLPGLCRQQQASVIQMTAAQVLAVAEQFDDILVLDGDCRLIEAAGDLLAADGILAIAGPEPLARPLRVDLGRIHYDHILYCGTTGLQLDLAYLGTPVRVNPVPGGTCWVLGAGGPMGRMHLQRALQSPCPPGKILATDVRPARVRDLEAGYAGLAREAGIEFHATDPAGEPLHYAGLMAELATGGGIDDVEVMASAVAPVQEAMQFLARGGVVNLFAGLKRGTMAELDAWQIYGPQQVRLIGHSGSDLADQQAVLERAAAGQLAPERSLVAVGGLRQVSDGVRAMLEATYAGKIVLYPGVPNFPLTALPDLCTVLPNVYALLGKGCTWTVAAEAAFLAALLPGCEEGTCG